jgi:hypothetical protein
MPLQYEALGLMMRACGIWVSLLAAATSGALAVQDPVVNEVDGPRTRQLWNEAFLKQRPASNSSSQRPARKAENSLAAPRESANSLGNAFVGITLWRMRHAVASDPVRFRGLEHPADRESSDEWTPERTTLDAPLEPGAFVRLSIESARPGYLYVIDRDLYNDESTGAPDLIFPTNRLRGGDNTIEPGIPIELPDAADRPPVFRIKATRFGQKAILLTIILTTTPIHELRTGAAARTLPAELVRSLERTWGSRVQRIENKADKTIPYSAREKAAALDHTQALGEDDPPPGALFYCRSCGPEDPVVATLTLRMESTNKP